MIETLKLLVMQFKESGRFVAFKRVDECGNPFWAVESVAVNKPIYAPLTHQEAVILASLCNLADDSDWSTLQPYVDELIPGFILKPDGG